MNQRVQFSTKPTQSPTPSPTTGREASGILEQLEAGVLKRGQTFAEMDIGDPRLAALEWILHHDGLQLVSDDSNLYQRFVLAIMAYSFDSFAWYVCGSLGENFNFTEYSYFPTSECSLNNAYTNVTESYGVWLSSTSECTWYGVICTPDGVIRGIELVMNDLIGQIPLELSAMGYLQYLGMYCGMIFNLFSFS